MFQISSPANIVFRLDQTNHYVHDVPVVDDLIADFSTENSGIGICLVTGKLAPIARLHPAIKGVDKVTMDSGSIVSYNQTAFESYCKKDGANAPVSVHAAFAYTTVLNYLLRRGRHNRQRIKIAETITVFWAQAADREQQEAAEDYFGQQFNPIAPEAPNLDAADGRETAKLNSALTRVVHLQAWENLDPGLDPDTKIFVLGLSPSSARLSIRFWITERLDDFRQRLNQHYNDLKIDPLPWKTPPAMWRLLAATTRSEKADDSSPHLAGSLTRAILMGDPYPRTLLSAVINRMRADQNVSGIRVALCKAVLARNQRIAPTLNQQEIPVSLNRLNIVPSYRLGRLFSVFESMQDMAIGPLNGGIKKRFYNGASTFPSRIFSMLIRLSNSHQQKGQLSNGTKEEMNQLAEEVREIMDGLNDSFPARLSLDDQALFALGYYHQTSDEKNVKSRKNKDTDSEPTNQEKS